MKLAYERIVAYSLWARYDRFTAYPLNILGRLRSWFLTGLVVSAPVVFTLYITWLIIDVLDSNVVALPRSGS